MTFEELQQTANEQNTRVFSLDCSLVYSTKSGFQGHHFKSLRQSHIHNACREVLLNFKFPFENMIPHIEYVHTKRFGFGFEKRITGISTQFSLYILNLPGMKVRDIQNLIHHFLDSFNHILTDIINVPSEIKSSVLILQFHYKHSLFSVLNDNPII